MKASYQVADLKDSRALAQLLSGEGAMLLPMLELIEQAEMAVDELIEVAGRATIEAVLTLSAEGLAGPKRPGKKGESAIGWYGHQAGVVNLAERKVRISKPRLRRKGSGKTSESRFLRTRPCGATHCWRIWSNAA